MNETNQFRRWLGVAANAVKRSLPDIKWDDFGNLLRPITTASEAFTGLGKAGAEYAEATPAERDESRAIQAGEMSDFDPNIADLAARVADGGLAGWALGHIAGKEAGEEEALTRVAAFLNDKPQLTAADKDGTWTADKLRAAIAG